MYCALLISALAQADDIGGVVIDAEGAPVPNVEVELRVGVARYSLTPNHDNWLFIGSPAKGQTDAQGRFSFQGLPEGAVASVFVKTDKGAGFAHGAKDLKLQLAPLGSVKGKISGKRQQLKGLRIWVSGCRGFASAEVHPDPKTGRFEIEGLPAGPARIHCKANNFDFAIRDVEVVSGKTVTVKTAKFTEKFITRGDPLVEVTKVKLVDEKGTPIAGVQMWWSSRWMDGGMNSDGDGIIKLAGGGVAIGGPPYILILRSLNREKSPLLGTYKKIKKGAAIVEVSEPREITGTVALGNEPVAQYRVAVVHTASKRVFHAVMVDGKYKVHLPEGKCRFVVGMADGKLREKEIDVQSPFLPITLIFPK